MFNCLNQSQSQQMFVGKSISSSAELSMCYKALRRSSAAACISSATLRPPVQPYISPVQPYFLQCSLISLQGNLMSSSAHLYLSSATFISPAQPYISPVLPYRSLLQSYVSIMQSDVSPMQSMSLQCSQSYMSLQCRMVLLNCSLLSL